MTTVERRTSRTDEAVLGRARRGDGEAFAQLVEPHRRELLVHCYRVLGSFHDAEDALQDTLASAWRALDGFDGRALRPWLYRIATNRCLNHRRDASRRPAPASDLDLRSAAGIGAADDPWWLEPFPDALLVTPDPGPEARYEARESVGLAFVAGLQHLPAQQRAVLVLRDVLGFSAVEAAAVLDVSAAAVNSALVRARGGFRPDRSSDEVPVARSPHEAAAVDRFADALQSGDPRRVVQALSGDVRLSMPPEPIRCDGPPAVADFLRARGCWGPDLQLVEAPANAQPAFGYYLPGPSGAARELSGLVVLAAAEDRIARITRFGPTSLGAAFGLAPTRSLTASP
ncbi:RNA polymerase subunit sigma-70 [Aquihabitans sp. G128]|uniref:RNA polymerase subunit sigma-70 n=1 Tax=Aquihabitans sp. G128 TaxID=2849779 RepID=UPI001C2372BA|nr:RNA polymerase subunit sigma-70 [Aquihabitans sp. G128]QXC60681.1 RNA polymerase subunit sigma-70 [Aquihabitans sp. G128]